MWFKTFLILYLISHISGMSFLDYLYPKKEVPIKLSGLYINAGVQITAHILDQLIYKPNATNEGIGALFVVVEAENNIVILNYTNNGNATEEKKAPVATKLLKAMLVKLNKEAEKLGMDEYQGFSDDILAQLSTTSAKRAPSQLLFALEKIDLTQVKETTKSVVEEVILQLRNKSSPLFKELEELVPLIYLPLQKAI